MKIPTAIATLAFLAIACRSAATPSPVTSTTPAAAGSTTATDVFVRTRVSVGDMFVPLRGAAALRDFKADVAADETGGECQLLRTGGSGATIVTAYYPHRADARFQATITFDSSGRVVRYNERRGVPHLPRTGLTAAQLESAIREAEASTRSTTISMDYPIDQAIATNRGGGKPTTAVLGTVREMESLASLGPPAARLERVRKLCGV